MHLIAIIIGVSLLVFMGGLGYLYEKSPETVIMMIVAFIVLILGWLLGLLVLDSLGWEVKLFENS